jgi:polygalacturonase
MFREFTTEVPVFARADYNILDFGAVAGCRVPCTEAFARAIEKASEKGGRVIVPNGIFLTGPIVLLSGVELYLEDNAVIIFTKSREDYPLMDTDFEGIRRIRARSQISADHAENIAITGRGTINGSGHLWRPVKQWKVTERQWQALLERSDHMIESREGGVWVPSGTIYEARYAGEVFPGDTESEEKDLEKAAPFYDFYRPVMVSLRHCRKVLIEGVHLQNSAAWNLHPYFCEDLTIRDVEINNPYYAQNGDGIDVDFCRRVHIHHCTLQTGDDGICLKSGKDREARKLLKPCEDVLIHDCKVGQSHGGFVIGSEMSRGVRNVLVRDCTFIDSDVGIRFKSALGRGGVVEEIYLRDIQMVNIRKEAVIITMDYVHNQMDYFDAVSTSSDPEDIPEFKNIYFERCICSDESPGTVVRGLEGCPGTVHDVYFKDCRVGSSGHGQQTSGRI